MNGASVVPGMRSFRPRQGPQSGRIQRRREFFGSLSLGRDPVGGCKSFIKIFLLLPCYIWLFFAPLIVQIRGVPLVEQLSKSLKITAFSAADSSRDSFTLTALQNVAKLSR